MLPPPAHRLTRRTILAATGGAAAALLGAPPAHPTRTTAQRIPPAASPAASPITAGDRPGTLTDATLRAFAAEVQAALAAFHVPGAAVALVQGTAIVFNRGFGVPAVDDSAPVTPHTRFRIASNTKAMTALLVATFVDQGVLAWDQPVVDAWPAFRAPTAALTRTLRVRDLLGMGSGLAESPTIEFFMMGGGDAALDLLRSVAYLPVIAPPQTIYFYNNTLYCVAGYLGSLVAQTPAAALEETYADLIQQRLFAPLGMADAAIADDPRPPASAIPARRRHGSGAARYRG